MWYYALAGTQHGPVSQEALVELARSGKLHASDLVWTEGMPEWLPLSDAPIAIAGPEPEPPPEPETRVSSTGFRITSRTSASEIPDPSSHPNPADTQEVIVPSELSISARNENAAQQKQRPDLALRVEQAQNRTRPKAWQFSFDAENGKIFALYLRNIIFTLLTLGIYRFWAKVAVRKFLYQHTILAEGRFDYHATGKEKFFGFLKGIVILSPFLVACYFAYQGLYSFFSDHGLPEELVVSTAIQYTFFLFFFLLTFIRPVIICGSMAFNLSRTSWNGLRFRFVGRIRDLYKIYAVDIFLMIITFGIYGAWHTVKVTRFKREHARFGGQHFGFTGTGGELFGIYFLGGILMPFTLYLYAPWLFAAKHRFMVNHTTYRGGRFISSLTGGQVFGFAIKAVFLMIFTLGLGFPLVVRMYQTLIMDTTIAHIPINLEELQAEFDDQASALAEGIGEAGEALEAIGDMFG